MSTVKALNFQIGQSVTATNNFTWYQPATPDGTVRLGNGNSGSVTDLVTLTSAGNLGIGTSSPNINAVGTALTILGSSTNRANLELGSTTASASSVFGQAAGYNGATLATLVQFFGDGATDSGAIKFFTKATGGSITERMRLDSSGNLGLGVTPSGWATNARAFTVGSTGSGIAGSIANSGATNAISLTHNAYYNSGWKYVYSGGSYPAGRYDIESGAHIWYTAPSGTAGNAISFTQAMTLDANGNLLVGTTTANSKLTVQDNISIRSGAAELLRINGQTATSVSTSATAILPAGFGYGALAIVNGYSGGNIFNDLVFFGSTAVNVIASQTNSGSPVARTYTCVAGQLKLAMASGTYTVTATQQFTNAY